MNGELAAMMKDACDKLIQDGEKAGTEYVKYLQDIRTKLIDSNELYKDTETGVTHSIKTIGEDAAKDTSKYERVTSDTVKDADGDVSMGDVHEAGVSASGTKGADTGGTDPVDLVSGQLLESDVDVALPGTLPLKLARAYASAYEHGGLLGPGWASTLDTRLLVGEDGAVRFLGDDAQCLDFGVPPRVFLQTGQTARPAYGPQWELGMDLANGQAYTVTDPWAGLTYLFTGDGPVRPLSGLRDRSGNTITVHHDDDGNPVLAEHSGGYRVRVRLAETLAGTRISGYYLETGDGPETLVEFGHDDLGRLDRVTDSAGSSHRYEYDDYDRVCAWTDRSGYRYPYRYDFEGRVVETGEPGGFKHARIAYDPDARVTRLTDALGSTREYHYDRYQQIAKVVDPRGLEARVRKDARGRTLEHVTPLGRVTRFEYDGDGNQTRITFPGGQSLAMTYSGPGQLATAGLPDGATWRYEWDARGHVLSQTDPLGAVTRFSYDEHGSPASITDPLGAVTRYASNAAGLPVAVISPSGDRTEIARNARGQVTGLAAADGQAVRIEYDSEGRVLARHGADGQATRYSYDAAGNRTTVTGSSGRTAQTVYGPFGLPLAQVAPDGSRTAYEYDAEFQLLSVTGPTGLAWRYKYNETGQLIAETDLDGRQQTYAYDEDGGIAARVAPDGLATRFQWDEAGHLAELRAGDKVSRFEHDPAGHLIRAENEHATVTFTRDLLGRAIREDVNGRTVTRTFDPAGNLLTRLTPSGARSEWAYDALGDVRSLMAGPARLRFTQDVPGQETRREMGGITLGERYDETGMLVRQQVSSAGRLLQERSYSYNADGLPSRIADLLNGTQELETDPLGRITGMLSAGRTERYSYDGIDNLTSIEITRPSGQAGDEEVSGPLSAQGTQVTRAGRTGYQYDARGRLVAKTRRTLSGKRQSWNYEWDEWDRLVSAALPNGDRWEYRYDPLGRRIEKNRAAGQDGTAVRTLFTWDGTFLAEQEQAGTGEPPVVLTWDYDPGGYRPALQRRSYGPAGPQEAADAEFWAIATSLSGAPQELISADGTIGWASRASSLGRPESLPSAGGDVTCPIGFPGQYYDEETALHYNNQRYYDSEIGYYISPDPMGLDPAPNPRRYVANPYVLCDPLGLQPVPKTDAQLQADADLIFKGKDEYNIRAFLADEKKQGGIDEAKKFANKWSCRNTVATYKADDGAVRYAMNGSGSYPGMQDIAKELGYPKASRISGVDKMDKVSVPKQTHAEQMILKEIGPDAKGRIAPSRMPCDWNPNSKPAKIEYCGAAITAHSGVRIVGTYANSGP